jgi:hypothetical protein
MFRVLTTAFLRFVRIVENSAECQKIDKMPSVPAVVPVRHRLLHTI